MFGLGKKKVDLVSPFAGEVVSVSAVPDPVFAQGMLGDGFAVIPPLDATVVDVVAPVGGTLKQVFPTGHAFAIKTDEGLEVLIHIGLDTVELKGEGFEALKEKGETVRAGEPIVRLDVVKVRELGRDPITPVVFTKKKQVAELKIKTGVVTDTESRVGTVTLA